MNLSVEKFLGSEGVVLDVRSPGEFSLGHIPGAVNLPLFTDKERAQVGTIYRREGKLNAIRLGWDLVTPKVSELIEEIERAVSDGVAKVHCWRGGMRSEGFAELTKVVGLETVRLEGGYKAYRRWCHEIFERPAEYRIVGGLTGTGKTGILKELEKMGEQILDLENLANHRGSAFGTIGMPDQPTTEQFHNDMAMALARFDPAKPIWIEDESRMIGTCHIPDKFFLKMRNSSLYIVERPLEKRLEILNRVYGVSRPEGFIEAVEKIKKKLGGKKTQDVIEMITDGKLKEACTEVLKYYDSAYKYDVSRRNQKINRIRGDTLDDEEVAKALLLSVKK